MSRTKFQLDSEGCDHLYYTVRLVKPCPCCPGQRQLEVVVFEKRWYCWDKPVAVDCLNNMDTMEEWVASAHAYGVRTIAAKAREVVDKNRLAKLIENQDWFVLDKLKGN